MGGAHPLLDLSPGNWGEVHPDLELGQVDSSMTGSDDFGGYSLGTGQYCAVQRQLTGIDRKIETTEVRRMAHCRHVQKGAEGIVVRHLLGTGQILGCPKVVTGIDRKDQRRSNGPRCCRQVAAGTEVI
jgi:hypothetical protein